jgi:hypothetical protein
MGEVVGCCLHAKAQARLARIPLPSRIESSSDSEAAAASAGRRWQFLAFHPYRGTPAARARRSFVDNYDHQG